MRRVSTYLGLILLTGLLTSCARLGPSIPAAPPGPTSSSSSPAASAGAAAALAVPHVSAAAGATTAQLGVQVYWHEVTDDEAVKGNADRLFDYAIGLGANSIGISFPIYTDGVQPTRVYTRDRVTPTPDSLQVVIGEAKARGLRVMLRPLIDEENIKDGAGAWRGTIKPRNITAWFASYQATMMPFLTAAEAAHADMFVLGSELDSLVGQAARWHALQAAAAAVFNGRLAYADNWTQWVTGRPGVSGVDPGLDAYPQLHLPDSATVAQIAAAWIAWFQRRPPELTRTVVQEVGIAATPGAYKEPAAWGKPGQTLAPRIQANWFAGACGAVKSLHMSGIYFWNLDAWADPTKAATYTTGSFIGRGDSAIKTCFAAGWPGQ
jgi:Glycoside Hydrolase Family 113